MIDLRLRYREILAACAATLAATAIAVPASSAKQADEPATAKEKTEAVDGRTSTSTPKVDAAIERGPAVIIAYLPAGVVDRQAVVEARAAATAQGAPFVALSATGIEDAKEVARRFGVTSTPALMVVDTEGNLLTGIVGFADRQTVEQAISNARINKTQQ